jgi:hypothetical protein
MSLATLKNKKAILKIKAKRLGTVKEVKEFLTDFENAYNSIYFFDFLVNTLSHDQDQRSRLLKEWIKYREGLSIKKNFWYDLFMIVLD